MKIAKRDSTKYMSNLQEKRVAKEMGGNTQIASGSLWFAPSDVRLEDFLIECKTTAKDFYSLTLTTWKKIVKESLNDGMRTPLMQIDLNDGEDRFVVISLDDYKGYDLDKKQEILDMRGTEKRSYRVVSDFVEVVADVNIPVYNVYSIKFKGRGTHLVVVDYDDFIMMMGGM